MMAFDPQQVGFAWPQKVVLTSPTGETLTISPYAVNFAGLRDANAHRIEECYRYYTSAAGILTELEVKKWLAGGDESCSRLLSAFRGLFGSQPGTRLPLSSEPVPESGLTRRSGGGIMGFGRSFR